MWSIGKSIWMIFAITCALGGIIVNLSTLMSLLQHTRSTDGANGELLVESKIFTQQQPEVDSSSLSISAKFIGDNISTVPMSKQKSTESTLVPQQFLQNDQKHEFRQAIQQTVIAKPLVVKIPPPDLLTDSEIADIIKQDISIRSKGQPVLGIVPTNGSVPLFGKKHGGGDAIFALACKYSKPYYQRFVGSLRKFGYKGDIVLAVSPPDQMSEGVAKYLVSTNVVAYGFEVDCSGNDNCKFKDDFLGYPDPRPYRTFANIRYALYEYWLKHYSAQSYILILDFRDTFFQADPFNSLGPVYTRPAGLYDLRMFAENHKVKNIGKCVYNSRWIQRCFGRPALLAIKQQPVICSGSTLGSITAIYHYIRTMLVSMDHVKCWLRGIESDQGYQNYLFYNGFFSSPPALSSIYTSDTTSLLSSTTAAAAAASSRPVNASLNLQGDNVVNTIGAMNGHRVPKHLKGPLDSFWKIRDSEGFILNNDGSRSACVHQWDRWHHELHGFVDEKLY